MAELPTHRHRHLPLHPHRGVDGRANGATLPDAMADALAWHDAILDAAIAKRRGVVFSRMGDGVVQPSPRTSMPTGRPAKPNGA